MKIDSTTAAVVTGGASGLGRATADALAAQGVKVAIFDINDALGEEVAAAIGGLFVHVDITDEQSVLDGYATARAAHGQERICVHCAMTSRRGKTLAFDKASGSFRRTPTEDYAFGVAGILTASYRIASISAEGMATLPELEDGERGAIVLTASVAAQDAQIGQVNLWLGEGGRERACAADGARPDGPWHPGQFDHARSVQDAARRGVARTGARQPWRVGPLPQAARPRRGICQPGDGDAPQQLFQRPGRPSRRRDPHGPALIRKLPSKKEPCEMSEAYIIDAVRTPRGIGKPGKGALSHLHPQHLAATVLKAIKDRNNLDTATVDDIIWSTSTQKGQAGRRPRPHGRARRGL